MTTRDRLQNLLHRILHPLVKFFISIGLTPNGITTIGLILNIGVAVIFILGAEEGARGDMSYIGWGGAMILFGGMFDMLDGQVARIGNMASRFGALYDSVLDRYSEMLMFLGICYYLVAHHYFFSSMVGFIALMGSIMVSYTRARAEGLGIPCKEGLMQRPERVVTIGLSALLCGIVAHYVGRDYEWSFPGIDKPFETIAIFTVPLALVAVLANYTAVQRLKACHRYMTDQDKNANH